MIVLTGVLVVPLVIPKSEMSVLFNVNNFSFIVQVQVQLYPPLLLMAGNSIFKFAAATIRFQELIVL